MRGHILIRDRNHDFKIIHVCLDTRVYTLVSMTYQMLLWSWRIIVSQLVGTIIYVLSIDFVKTRVVLVQRRRQYNINYVRILKLISDLIRKKSHKQINITIWQRV